MATGFDLCEVAIYFGPRSNVVNLGRFHELHERGKGVNDLEKIIYDYSYAHCSTCYY
jgi:hypothetical protein